MKTRSIGCGRIGAFSLNRGRIRFDSSGRWKNDRHGNSLGAENGGAVAQFAERRRPSCFDRATSIRRSGTASSTFCERGVTVFGGSTTHRGIRPNLAAVLDQRPGSSARQRRVTFSISWRRKPDSALLGGTEETTSGRMRLEPLRGELAMPILVINDSPIKQFAENEHAVGQGVRGSCASRTGSPTISASRLRLRRVGGGVARIFVRERQGQRRRTRSARRLRRISMGSTRHVAMKRL